MLSANIIKPDGVLCGACNIIVTLFEPIQMLQKENIKLSGDVDDLIYDVSGKGNSWMLGFSFPEDRKGKFTIELQGDVDLELGDVSVALEQVALDVEYDTCHVFARWGDVIYEKNKIIVPIELNEKVSGLSIENFIIKTGQYDFQPQLYGIGDTDMHFQLEFNIRDVSDGEIHVSSNEPVLKENGQLCMIVVNDARISVVEKK